MVKSIIGFNFKLVDFITLLSNMKVEFLIKNDDLEIS